MSKGTIMFMSVPRQNYPLTIEALKEGTVGWGTWSREINLLIPLFPPSPPPKKKKKNINGTMFSARPCILSKVTFLKHSRLKCGSIHISY